MTLRRCCERAGYALAQALGWIGEEQAALDHAAHEERRRRALQTCHRHGLYERPRFDPPRDNGAYVPELAAGIEDDRNLTDGARRCARKFAEETYRRNREGRSLEVTVTYLMKALGKCRRTVQRYLRLLDRTLPEFQAKPLRCRGFWVRIPVMATG